MVLFGAHPRVHLSLRAASHYQSTVKKTEKHLTGKLQQSPLKHRWDLIPQFKTPLE